MHSNVLFLLLISGGVLCALLGLPMMFGKVKPNRWYGFRTKKTLNDEKIWYAANGYAGKWLIACGIIMAAAGIILLIVMPAIVLKKGYPGNDKYAVIFLIATMVPITTMVIASLLKIRKL